jgi:hypothetical protein
MMKMLLRIKTNGKIRLIDTKMKHFFKKIYNCVLHDCKPVREWMLWGTFGKSGKDPLKFVILKNMSDEHITKILETQHHIGEFYRTEFENELTRRINKPEFSIKETT